MIEKGYGASVIGKSHINNNIPNQDSYLIDNEDDYTLAVVCDGLGSKKYSHRGSKKLCKVLKRQIKKCYKRKEFNFVTLLPLIKKKWKRAIWPIKPNKADTTCIFAIVNSKNIMMGQIGDGLCAIKIGAQLYTLKSKDDDFSNETVAFYKGEQKDWQFQVYKKDDSNKYLLLLCTDGISEDLKQDMISEFIDELDKILELDVNNTDNKELKQVIENWPNKYSNDDKTMVVIRE